MQNKYVLNNKYKLSIDKVKNILKDIYNKIQKSSKKRLQNERTNEYKKIG